MWNTRRPIPRWILGVIAATAAIEAVIVAFNLSPLIDRPAFRHLVGLKAEASFNSWFSSALLLVIAFLSATASYVERSRGAPRRRWWGLAAIAVAFVVLSIDETAATHELMGVFVDRYLDIAWAPGGNNWIFVVTPVAAAFTAWMVYWTVTEFGIDHPSTRLVLAAGVLWVMVPVWHAISYPLGTPIVLSIIEEASELAGEVLFIAAIGVHVSMLMPFTIGKRPHHT